MARIDNRKIWVTAKDGSHRLVEPFGVVFSRLSNGARHEWILDAFDVKTETRCQFSLDGVKFSVDNPVLPLLEAQK